MNTNSSSTNKPSTRTMVINGIIIIIPTVIVMYLTKDNYQLVGTFIRFILLGLFIAYTFTPKIKRWSMLTIITNVVIAAIATAIEYTFGVLENGNIKNLLILQIVLATLGVFFLGMSKNKRTEHYKGISFSNPLRLSYYRTWFTSIGYRYILLSSFCLSASGLLGFVYFYFLA